MKIILLFILTFSRWPHPSGEIDYRKIFGRDYTFAVQWLHAHDEQIRKYAQLFDLPAKELKAIVFPELIRYNRVFDAIEIESLKYLYVSEGKHYADFSVGYFQMKPSFAEEVEKDAVRFLDAAFIQQSGIKAWEAMADNELSRRERVRRITNTGFQLIYLSAFYKICQYKFGLHPFHSPVERVRFFATCYNAGYSRSEAGILNFQSRNQFYSCNYSAVSAYYFEKE